MTKIVDFRLRYIKQLLVFLIVSVISIIANSMVYSQEFEYKDGIKYIHNDKPLWKGKSLVQLKHIRTIGGIDEDDEDYIMSEICDLHLDKNNNIYIIDFGVKRIQKYSPKGRFEKTIGRPGEGPGEFFMPISISIDDKEIIYITDGLHVKILKSSGKEIKRFLLKTRFRSRIRFINAGQLLIGSGWTAGGGTPNSEFIPLFSIYDLDGNIINEFGEAEIFQEKNSSGNQVYTANGRAHFEIDGSGKFYISYGIKNLIEKRNYSGEIIFQSDRKINFKETKYRTENGRRVNPNIISTCIGIDSHERIWVSTITKQPEKWDRLEPVKKENAKFEIFDSEGILLGELPLPQDIFRFRIFGDRLFIIDYDRVSVSEYKIIELN